MGSSGPGRQGCGQGPREEHGRHQDWQEGLCHVAQDMAALCSLAFMRSAAMLEVLRSGSLFIS